MAIAVLPSPASRLQFVVVRDIKAPAAAVFDIVTSPAGMRAWVPLCRSADWRHPAGRQVPGKDSVRYIVLKGGLVAAERIVGWEADHELQYTFAESSIPLGAVTTNYVGSTRVEGVGVGPTLTRLTWSIYFDTPGWQSVIAPVMRFNLRAFIGLMASNVKRAAEAGAR